MSNQPPKFGYKDHDSCSDCTHAIFHGDETGRTYASCAKYVGFLVADIRSRGCDDFDCVPTENQ